MEMKASPVMSVFVKIVFHQRQISIERPRGLRTVEKEYPSCLRFAEQYGGVKILIRRTYTEIGLVGLSYTSIQSAYPLNHRHKATSCTTSQVQVSSSSTPGSSGESSFSSEKLLMRRIAEKI